MTLMVTNSKGERCIFREPPDPQAQAKLDELIKTLGDEAGKTAWADWLSRDQDTEKEN